MEIEDLSALSRWHVTKWRVHGPTIVAEMRQILKPNERFSIPSLTSRLQCVRHLKSTTANDTVLAVCGVLRQLGVVDKQGTFYIYTGPASIPIVLDEPIHNCDQSARICAGCLYGRFGLEEDRGECFRYPPVFTGSEWARPPIAADDYCGEWIDDACRD